MKLLTKIKCKLATINLPEPSKFIKKYHNDIKLFAIVLLAATSESLVSFLVNLI